jgi:hypothetical protein
MLGMRGNGDWVTDQRPKNWRQQILKLYPNGQAPLTAMLSMMRSSAVDDPEFYWWTKTFSEVGGAVAGVYTLPDLSVAYVSGAVDGSILYLSVTEVLAARVRAGHTILMRDASDYTVDVVGKVIGVTHGLVNSVLAVKLLEADDNSTLGDLSNCDTFKIIGNSNPEAEKCLMRSRLIQLRSITKHRSSEHLFPLLELLARPSFGLEISISR